MRRVAVIIAALAFAAAAKPGFAATDQDLDDCWGSDYAARLDACPKLFRDPDEDPGIRASAYLKRAQAYETRGEWADAALDYIEAVALDPDNADYYFARARAYAAMGDTEEALADFTRAIGRDPAEAEYRSARGAFCQAQGNIEGAIADYSAAIRLAPDVASTYFYRGDAHRLRGDLLSAIADFDAAVQRDPGSTGARLARADSYRILGESEVAFADYSEVITRDATLAGAYFGRALAEVDRLDVDAAILDFSRAIDLDRTNAVLRNMRGFAYAAKGDFDRAIADHEAAILIDPTDAYRYTIRAWAYLKAGKPALGLEDAERALALDPGLASAYATRGRIHEALDSKVDAIADFRKALELSPEMHAARDGLARLGVENLPEIVPVAAPVPPAAFDNVRFVLGLYEETAFSRELFAREDDVLIRENPDSSFDEDDWLDAGDKLDVVARLKPRKGAYCGVDSPRGWYRVRYSGGRLGYVRASDVLNAEQQKLLANKKLIAKHVTDYESKNHGSLKNFAGVYDGLKGCKTEYDPDGLLILTLNLTLKQVIWFEDSNMYNVRFSHPDEVHRARLKFQRNFNLAGGGVIKLYRATYDDAKPETLGFYNDKLVIDPKISGNRITYQYATRCDEEAGMVEWAGKVLDGQIASEGEE